MCVHAYGMSLWMRVLCVRSILCLTKLLRVRYILTRSVTRFIYDLYAVCTQLYNDIHLVYTVVMQLLRTYYALVMLLCCFSQILTILRFTNLKICTPNMSDA